jgi:hypothetical protein
MKNKNNKNPERVTLNKAKADIQKRLAKLKELM